MNITKVAAHVDADRRLSVQVPDSIHPGPVTVLVVQEMQEDEESEIWTAAVAREWADDLADPAQDIYTMNIQPT